MLSWYEEKVKSGRAMLDYLTSITAVWLTTGLKETVSSNKCVLETCLLLIDRFLGQKAQSWDCTVNIDTRYNRLYEAECYNSSRGMWEKTIKFWSRNCTFTDIRDITVLLLHTTHISIITSVCVVMLRGVETPIAPDTLISCFNDQAFYLVVLLRSPFIHVTSWVWSSMLKTSESAKICQYQSAVQCLHGYCNSSMNLICNKMKYGK